jgi:hypothetical protein
MNNKKKAQSILKQEYKKILYIISEISGELEYDLDKWIRNHSRKAEIIVLRKIAIYLLIKSGVASKSAIGQYIKGRDHSTIIHSENSVNDTLDCRKHPHKEFYLKCINLYENTKKYNLADPNDPMDINGKPDYDFKEFIFNKESIKIVKGKSPNKKHELSYKQMMFYRNNRIWKLYNQGKSHKDIGELFNLTVEGIKYIIKKHNERYKISKSL